jgi:hypothetical protein
VIHWLLFVGRRLIIGRVRGLAVSVSLMVLGMAGSAASLAATPSPLGTPSATVTVARGSWGGHAWTLKAGDTDHGDLGGFASCVSLVFANTAIRGAAGCDGGGGPLSYKPPAPAPIYGMNLEDNGDACPEVIVGTVVATAREVTITLPSGATVKTATIPPRGGLTKDARFYATQAPCGQRPSSVVARDAAGQVVARVALSQLGQP